MSQEHEIKKRPHVAREILETIILTLLIFLVLRFAVQNYRVDGQSMEPSLHDQEYILVDKAAYLFHPPERGDVIVFEYPGDTRIDYIKRIIAIPGDIISIVGQTVTVDGVRLNEPYINKDDLFNPFPPTNRLVGQDDYFVLGDNRGNSSDSREWGFVPRQNIIGKAALAYWPFGEDNLGLLFDFSSVFARIHQ